jgi:hypothetical protein
LNKKKNSGTFKSGHKKFAGRQRGTLNKKTVILQEAGLEKLRLFETPKYFLDHENDIVRFHATKEISKYLFAIREH